MLFERFFPYEYADSSYAIDYEKLYADGIRGLIYDVDNTLVCHGAPANEEALELMDRLKKIGFKITFLSNNDEARVKMFNEKIGANYIYKAGKPSIRGYIKAAMDMECKLSEVVFVGDQLFTDIWGANRSGIKSYLVKPIDTSTDEIQIVLKRKLEKIVLRKYFKLKQK